MTHQQHNNLLTKQQLFEIKFKRNEYLTQWNGVFYVDLTQFLNSFDLIVYRECRLQMHWRLQ